MTVAAPAGPTPRPGFLRTGESDQHTLEAAKNLYYNAGSILENSVMASSATRWSHGAINRAWSRQSLRILVDPSPITFAERRSVLQALQQKGAIEVFTPVPDYPSQFIAVTKTEETADSLRTAEALSYTIASPQKTPDIRYTDLSKPDSIDGTKATIHPDNTAGGVDHQGQMHKQFWLRIVDLDKYNHSRTMSSSPLTGPWPESYTRRESFMSSVLKQSLPQNMAAQGLARWDYNLKEGGATTPKKERLQLQRWIPSNMKKTFPECTD